LPAGSVAHAAFSPDGRRLAAAVADPDSGRGSVHVWDVATKKPATPKPLEHDLPVNWVAFSSPEGRYYLATAGGEEGSRPGAARGGRRCGTGPGAGASGGRCGTRAPPCPPPSAPTAAAW